MSYLLQRTSLGWCWLDLIALAVLVGVVAWYVVKINKMKQQQKALEDKLAGKAAEAVIPGVDSIV